MSALMDTILALLEACPVGMSRVQIQDATGATETVARKRLAKLEKTGEIVRVGTGMGTRYACPRFKERSFAAIVKEREAQREKSRQRKSAKNKARWAKRVAEIDNTPDMPVVRRIVPAATAPRPAAKINSVWALSL